MKRKLLALLVLSAILLGVAGCGQQAAPTATATPTGVEQKVTGSRKDPGH
jgi:predicted small lipoprotein YifL